MVLPNQTRNPPRAEGPMPVLFVGHGSPLNALEDNRWSRGFAALANLMTRPKAVLVISAHWFVDGTYLTGASQPRTIYDFHGFPSSLYEIDYPAPGHVDLAHRIQGLLREANAPLDPDWGLDHGTWSVLRWMFPEADVPVIQLSIDRRLPPSRHYALGQSLRALREEGVLIVGSGNVVHNLSDAFRRWRAGNHDTPAWAEQFDRTVAEVLSARDTRTLLSLWPHTENGILAHPTPDHWLPLLYAYGASSSGDAVEFPTIGFDWGSLSMRNVVFGAASP